MLSKLPMAYLAGLRVRAISEEQAVVSIPYKYLNKNPFNSIYFACLSMAAELPTGMLGMMHVYRSSPSVSMLLVNMEANFSKKAVGLITFRCEDGSIIRETVEKAKATGTGQTVTVVSVGTDEQGEQVALFRFTWSFKTKVKQ